MKNKILTLSILCAFGVNAQLIKIKKPDLSSTKKDPVESSTTSKAQVYIDGAKASIKKLDEKLQDPNWGNSSFEAGFNSELENLASKIKSIKRDDPKYNTSEFEEKHNSFQKAMEQGLKEVKDKNAAIASEREKNEKNAEKAKHDELHKKIKDEGITSVLHTKNVGKIVFSNMEISKTSPVESSLKTDFDINKSIHFRVYLKESIFNTLVSEYNPDFLARDSKFRVKFYIDGNLAYNKSLSLNGTEKTYMNEDSKKVSTTFAGILDFKDDAIGSFEFIEMAKRNEGALTVGNHKLKIEIYAGHMSTQNEIGEMLANGEINLNVVKGYVDPKNYVICMPTSKKKDPALEAKFMTEVKKYMVNNNLKGTAKSLVLRSTDWEIEKNEYTGRIISRTMYAAVGISDETKCTFKVFSFTQFWDGNTYQSTISVETTSGGGDIFCDCMR